MNLLFKDFHQTGFHIICFEKFLGNGSASYAKSARREFDIKFISHTLAISLFYTEYLIIFVYWICINAKMWKSCSTKSIRFIAKYSCGANFSHSNQEYAIVSLSL